MDHKKILALKDFIISSEKSIKSAKKILKDILTESWIKDVNLDIDYDTNGLNSYSSEESKIIEWVFTWEDMLGVDGNNYPVPANYASKSKLVQWDKLKLTIEWSGKMTYKQILPIARESKIGLLTKENGKYQVIVDWKTYNLLTAAVTHFKCEVWDTITIIIPEGKQATFAAIEAIVPKEAK